MNAKYRISEDDYVNAMKLYGKLTVSGVIILATTVAVLIALAVFGPPVARGAAISGLIVGTSIFVIGRYIVSPMVGRRQYRKYKAIQEEFTIQLHDDGVHLHTGESYSKIKWANIQKWRHNDDYILIFPMPRIYYVIPKSSAAGGFDIALLLTKLTQNIGQAR